ncbi:MAG: hypothetical protein K9K38_00940 [Rhodoferax sp.]|nr:hypothetical protein [Rhodoferax sp.]
MKDILQSKSRDPFTVAPETLLSQSKFCENNNPMQFEDAKKTQGGVLAALKSWKPKEKQCFTWSM